MAASTGSTGARFLTPEGVATRLGVSRYLVFKMLREGRIPSIKLGNKRLIPLDAIDRLEAEAYRSIGQGGKAKR
jgi:excisionase family DNA binding protein